MKVFEIIGIICSIFAVVTSMYQQITAQLGQLKEYRSTGMVLRWIILVSIRLR